MYSGGGSDGMLSGVTDGLLAVVESVVGTG